MKISIVGAGAVGLYLAARFSASDEAVGVVARGAALEALRGRGGRYVWRGEPRHFVVRATDRPEELGPQDLVLIAVKAYALRVAAPSIAKLIGPETILLPTQNGVPWWYTHKIGGVLEGVRLASIDPGGGVAAALDPARALGCVVYIAASLPEPGTVRHLSGNRFILGEPDGSTSARLRRVVEAFTAAGIEVETTSRIRDALWLKLWGNMIANPMSVLTRGTLLDLCNDRDTLAVMRQAMVEARTIGDALGVRFEQDLEQRIEETRSVGPHKSSTLQDFEGGRTLEIEALLGAPLELGHRLGIATPALDAIAALTRLTANLH
jgi:2-dehydropantoate 2-reductase